MFDIFGEFDTVAELNATAEGLKNEGDADSLRKLAKENGIEEAFADMYMQGVMPEFCDVAKKQVTEEHDNAEQKPADESETYKPLPGQTKIEDIPELQADNTMAAAESAIDAEYREIDQEADAQAKDSDKYSDVEIQNAVNFFEVEYYRMVGTGLKESAKCRNYRIALEAIRECYVSR